MSCKNFELIGMKIRELSIEKIAGKNVDKNKINSILTKQQDLLQSSEASLYIHLGELFINLNEENKKNLIAFADEFGKKLIDSKLALELPINLFNKTRCSILELLEQEFRKKRLSDDVFFESIKIVESLYKVISDTLVNHYNNELSFTKYALDESNRDLKNTLRGLADLQKVLDEATIFSITDHEDRISYVNDKFCRLFKYSRDELIGKKHYVFFSDFHQHSFFQDIWKTLLNGNVWNGEILNKAKDGTMIWLDTTFIPFVDEDGRHYQHIAIQYDITERKKAEETLHKAEKLSVIGELAAGLAHEIRNPLTTIRGFVQFISENGNAENYTNTILEEIDRINFIVNEFMVFAKPHTVYYSVCDVSDLLRSVIKLLEPEALLKNVLIEYEIPSEGLQLNGEKNQLKQVFLNLIKNAIDSMPYGGKVYISIEGNDPNIIINIKDEGIGMGEEQIKRLGEPFFSTKDDGNGLGLMVSYKIIQDHKGTINVISKPGEGTTFIILFNRLSD